MWRDPDSLVFSCFSHFQPHAAAAIYFLPQVKAQPEFTKKEMEVFLRYVQDCRLERQLMALYSRLVGVSALTDRPMLLEELILNRRPKRWELQEFCVKVCEDSVELICPVRDFEHVSWPVLLSKQFGELGSIQLMAMTWVIIDKYHTLFFFYQCFTQLNFSKVLNPFPPVLGVIFKFLCDLCDVTEFTAICPDIVITPLVGCWL